MVVGFVVGFGVVGCVVGAVCEGDFGAGTTVAGVGGFVAGGWLVVFGVGVVVDFVVVGGGVVDVVKTSPILPITINAADEVGDALMGGGVSFAVVVVDVEGVVDCCGCCCMLVCCSCCCCCVVVCLCCYCRVVVCCGCCCCGRVVVCLCCCCLVCCGVVVCCTLHTSWAIRSKLPSPLLSF